MDYTIRYYDLVLLVIAGCLVAGGLVGTLTTVPFSVAVPVTGALALVVIFHGLFVNGPIDEPRDLADEVDALT